MARWIGFDGCVDAEPDQRNASGLTAFHVAVQNGHLAVVKYFFRQLPPSDDDNQEIYKTPSSTNLLRLALDSAIPELVWLILEKKETSNKQINEAWTWICSEAATNALTQASKSKQAGQDLRLRSHSPENRSATTKAIRHQSVSRP